MGIFGWSLPPGVTMNDIDPPERPCEVCGIESGNCICPECPSCGSAGDPKCYEEHGLVRTQAQIDGKAALDAQLNAEREADAAWAEHEARMYEETDR